MSNPADAAAGDGRTTTLAAQTPILLMPVRIETRFVDTDKQSQLLLRVYPDTINVSSFEAGLTDQEIASGQEYWTLVWRAGTPPQTADAPAAAWRGLAAKYTPRRAAWIALTLTPTNLSSQPAAATAEGADVSPLPAFASPPTRATSYERAPATLMLPDRWFVYLLDAAEASRVVAGGPIATDLAVGLAPRDGNFPDGLPVDAGMQWLVDFDAAVKAGMGMRIPLSAEERAAGFKRITVIGVRDSSDWQGNTDLATLLQSHHYTDGVAFVPQGAPTNNTADASSAFSRKDPDYATSFAVERGSALTGDAAADGAVAASMLGVAANVFDHVQFADGHGRQNARDMMTALWPATLGYFLEQMMDPVFNDVRQDEARRFAIDNAVPRGLLPALRVGNTPYGVLPITSLEAYPAPAQRPFALDDPEASLAAFVKALLPLWRNSLSNVPRIGGSTDPDQDLVRILGMDASSLDFRARHVLGDQVVWNLFQLFAFGTGVEEWWLEHAVRGSQLLNSVGLGAWQPRVLQTSMGRDSYPVTFPNIQTAPLSETDPLKNDAGTGTTATNYIAWLLGASLNDIWAENYPGPKPTSLLYRILRQSVMREYVTLAGRAQIATGVLPAVALREAELVHVAQASPTITSRDIVDRPISAGSSTRWADFIFELGPTPEPQYMRFAELRVSLGRLASLPTAELDRLMTETLDAFSHRLDVWGSAVANSILQRQRSAQPQTQSPRLHMGAYGWLDDVVPAAQRVALARVDSTDVARLDNARRQQLPAATTALRPVMQPPGDNGGFIHAPSMAQAATAAVLRSGWLSHRNSPDEAVLDIDLSSERVRRALWLLDGIRQGQSLGALTGFIFEAALHEANLDVYAQPFRDLYPLIGDELTASTASGEPLSPPQVVDGVKLRAAWQSGSLAPGAYWGAGLPLPALPANADQVAVLAILADIDDRMDGLGDVSLAESVFQIMRGSYGRAGGILDAISRGDHPPDPDIVTTPRAGLDVTQRIMLLFAGPPASPAWASGAGRVRGVVEPWVSSWVASRLPDPATARCRVGWKVGGAAQTVLVALTDLGIGPLDLLAMADAADQPQKSELEARIIYQANPPAGATGIAITYDVAGLPAGSISFPDVMFVARTLRDLLGAARALEPQSFSLPNVDAAKSGAAVDLGELNARAAALVAKLQSDVNQLQAALAAVDTAPQPVREALFACSFYGIAGSVPQPPALTTSLSAQGGSVLSQLQTRQKTGATTPLPAATVDGALAVFDAILGAGQLVIPHFSVPDLAGLQSSFAQSSAMSASDPMAPQRWLLQLSHVRPGPMRLDLALGATALLGAPDAPLTLAQLPPMANDRWLGLPLDPAHPPTQGRVALAAVAIGNPTTATTFAGLMIDEFLERIPLPNTSAGVAFHFDEPDARAPQALLLAVCPDGRANWDLDLLNTILQETLELAGIRGVDLDSLGEAGQILPALYFPFNIPEATPSVRFLETGAADAVFRRTLS
jgi:hypothetical protein